MNAEIQVYNKSMSHLMNFSILGSKGTKVDHVCKVAIYFLSIVPHGRFRVFILGIATDSTSFSLILSFRKHHLNNMAPKKTEGKVLY